MMKRQTIISIALIALTAFSADADDNKDKGKKDEPRKVEIAADATKIRAALIKAELAQGYELGDEQPSLRAISGREGWFTPAA
jgi:hypothetical protein